MPSWREIERFCRRDGWQEYKKKGHHLYFKKEMADGMIKRTKVSRGTGEVRGHLSLFSRRFNLPLYKDKASGGCHGFLRGDFRVNSKKSGRNHAGA